MPTASLREVLTRHAANPLLTRADWHYPVNAVFNAGATKLPSGQTLLLCRVEDCTGISHLCAARSDDGIGGWIIDKSPTLMPDPENFPEEEWGIEDPRVVWHEELGKYSVTYCCYSNRGPAVSLALTVDFKSFQRIGNIFPPENKDPRWRSARRTG